MIPETKMKVPPIEKFTIDEATTAVRDAIEAIKKSYYGYGLITVTVSGREIKHVNIEIPYRNRKQGNSV